MPRDLAGACADVLKDHLARLRQFANHPNRVLHYDQMLVVHLLGFFDPVVRSLRTLDGRTVADQTMRQATDDLRAARSTMSDAMNELSADALLPLLKQLLQRLPSHCSHPELADLMTLKKRILAIDGSYFRVPADVLWALSHRRPNNKMARQVRLDLHLDVLRFLPVNAGVGGEEQSSESAAFAKTMEPGVIYLADRNFVDFDFIRAVIKNTSDLVVRLKSVAKIRHLFAESSNGITMQFYIVIIATLMSYLHTGARPSVYTFMLLSSAARGTLVLEKVPEVLERIAREREQERQRRLKKKSI